MARTDNLKNYLTDVANAIREKTNTTDKIKASEFDTKIKAISGETSGASEQWEWALNNVINFGVDNPRFFAGNTYLKTLPNYLNERSKEIVNMSTAFSGCTKLTEIELDVSNAENFYRCFEKCSSMINAPTLTPTKATNMSYLFSECTNLQTVQNEIDTSNANNLSYLFNLDYNLTKVRDLNTANAQNLAGMFYDCFKLEVFPTINCRVASNLSSLYYGCKKLTNEQIKLTNISTSRSDIDASYMFYECTSLEKIEDGKINAISFSNMQNFAQDCTKLREINIGTTYSCTNALSMFNNCNALETVKTLNLSKISNAQNQRYMFNNCVALKNVEFIPNTIRWSISFANSPLLTTESVQNIINALLNISTAQTVTFHKDVVITDEQKTTITEKGWTLVQA